MSTEEMEEMFKVMNPRELGEVVELAMMELVFRRESDDFSLATQEESGEVLTSLADEYIHHASCEAIDEMYHDLHEESYNDYEEHPGVVTYRQQ